MTDVEAATQAFRDETEDETSWCVILGAPGIASLEPDCPAALLADRVGTAHTTSDGIAAALGDQPQSRSKG